MKALDYIEPRRITDYRLGVRDWSWLNISDKFKYYFVIFWLASLIGHFLEIWWAYFRHYIFGSPLWMPTIVTVIPLAAPYGFGAVAILLLIWPLMKRPLLKPAWIFGLSVLITGFVEYLCAAFLVIFYGHNKFWNYSDRDFNIDGYVCLESSLIFGVSAMIFLYLVYPFFLNKFNKFPKRLWNVLFWVFFASFIIDILLLILLRVQI